MAIRTLSSVSEVVDALGGTAAVARLTRGRMQTVSNWRERRRFPSGTHVMLTEAQAEIGCHAPSALWRMRERAEARS